MNERRLNRVDDGRKNRLYDSSTRLAAADLTRRRIREAALRLFLALGYKRTTVAAIAKRAGVAVDTVYESAGTKVEIFRYLIETAISGGDEALPALERDYVRAVRAEPRAADKLVLYARAIAAIHGRLAPLMMVVREASGDAPEIAELWHEISERRAANMRMFAEDLCAAGEVRPELGVEAIEDFVWATNSPEFYSLLVTERGWTPETFADWLAETWQRLFLEQTLPAR